MLNQVEIPSLYLLLQRLNTLLNILDKLHILRIVLVDIVAQLREFTNSVPGHFTVPRHQFLEILLEVFPDIALVEVVHVVEVRLVQVLLGEVQLIRLIKSIYHFLNHFFG